MRATLPLACALAISWAVAAQARDDTKGTADPPKQEATSATKLAWNPFAQARAGEWETLLVTSHTNAPNSDEQSLDTWKVASVAQDKVTTTRETRAAKMETKKQSDETCPPKEITVGDFLHLFTHDPVTGVKVEEEKKKVAGKELACTKISCSWRRTKSVGPGMTVFFSANKLTVWISKDVRGPGIVAYSLETKLGQGATLFADAEVAGFGNAEKAEWGKKTNDIVLEGETPEPGSDDPKDK